MAKFYRYSKIFPNKSHQVDFNNKLTKLIRTAAKGCGYDLSLLTMTQLRIRIRSYYRSQWQSAERRLATMLKDPEKLASQRHVANLWTMVCEGKALQGLSVVSR